MPPSQTVFIKSSKFNEVMKLLWCLLTAGLALGCEWDNWEDQGLDLDSHSPYLGNPTEVKDAEECKAACCLKRGCDVAMVGAPQDGPLQCYLVTCWILGSDQCQPLNSSQFQVHRRRQKHRSESNLRPLFGEPKPENKENNQKDENREGKETSCNLITIKLSLRNTVLIVLHFS